MRVTHHPCRCHTPHAPHLEAPGHRVAEDVADDGDAQHEGKRQVRGGPRRDASRGAEHHSAPSEVVQSGERGRRLALQTVIKSTNWAVNGEVGLPCKQ
eukprot:353149-Chlamydomonas_euryale.AAC.4